jgi:hypothetical protein
MPVSAVLVSLGSLFCGHGAGAGVGAAAAAGKDTALGAKAGSESIHAWEAVKLIALGAGMLAALRTSMGFGSPATDEAAAAESAAKKTP